MLSFKQKLAICFGLLVFFSSLFSVQPRPLTATDPVEDLQRQIDELNKLKQQSVDATKPLEKELSTLESRIKTAQQGIVTAKQQATKLAGDIEKREEDLAVQYHILSKRIGEQYKRSRLLSPLLTILSTDNAAKLTQDLAYQDSVKAQDNRLIQAMSGDISQLEKDKQKLESDQVKLAALEKQLDEQTKFFEAEIAKAKTYQQDLSGKIANLSAQQQSIINARSGTATTSVGDVPLADDPNASIAYKAQAPGNSFAVFSFGAYTHRKGMSQYGAKKQAENGKNYKDIIKWYYGKDTKKDDGMADTIEVQGYGSMSFQKYLYGIAEMPSGWHDEALKAQAVAARTYAKKSGKPICTTEACQVFNKGKSDNPPEKWKKAVDDTEKEIIDGDVSSQYSSTAGGYITTSGWDTTDRNGDGNWSSKAWESMAGSPWFYKSWYRSGYSSSGANCGKSHPWLSQEEFADIVNAWLVRKNPNGADVNRIQPVTINDCNVGGSGGNPYSIGELRDKANGAGGAVTSISSVSVSHNNTGQTTNVKLQTNRGEINIPGSEFKETFNLRAPGYLRIPQSGFAFFNIEHKN
jgi:peptidoglycan hydrolase-like amidase